MDTDAKNEIINQITEAVRHGKITEATKLLEDPKVVSNLLMLGREGQFLWDGLLTKAILSSNLDMVKLLLEKGVPADDWIIRDQDTPLLLTVHIYNRALNKKDTGWQDRAIQMAELLLRRGANPDYTKWGCIESEDGCAYTPYDLAKGKMKEVLQPYSKYKPIRDKAKPLVSTRPPPNEPGSLYYGSVPAIEEEPPAAIGGTRRRRRRISTRKRRSKNKSRRVR